MKKFILSPNPLQPNRLVMINLLATDRAKAFLEPTTETPHSHVRYHYYSR
jgi:hypothetical protein